MIATPDLLDALRRQPGLPDDVWYVVAATALCVLNLPEQVPAVYRHAVQRHGSRSSSSSSNGSLPNGTGPPAQVPDHDDVQRRIARRLREALLKASAIGGMPKTINALQELKKVVPAHLADDPPPPPHPHHDDGAAVSSSSSPTRRREDVYGAAAPDVLARGQAFFDRCYGKVARRVMDALDRCGTEDLGLAVRVTYGYVLSPTAVLSEAETSFVMIAGLVPQDVSKALFSCSSRYNVSSSSSSSFPILGLS